MMRISYIKGLVTMFKIIFKSYDPLIAAYSPQICKWQQGIDKMQSLNSEGPCICSALKQTLRGSPCEEMKHQPKISASPGPVSIPAKRHPDASFSCMNPHRTQSHLTVPPLQAKSSDREQDSVLPLSSHVSSPAKPFQQRGQRRQRW